MPSSPSRYFKHFLTSETALRRRFERDAGQMRFTGRTPKSAVSWQKKARAKFARHLGLHLFEKCPAHPRKRASVRVGDLIREEWVIQTERDVWMPFYLFIPPEARKGKVPLVLCPHGHGSAGKWATGGRHDIPAMRPLIRQYNYDYGVQLARAGFITACPDARGFGERRETANHGDRKTAYLFQSQSCHQLMLAGAPLGLNVQGMWTWDLMRLVDHLVRDPRIDSRRIGCVGLSGGGLQTLALAAVDTRIRAAVDSGYFYGVRESLQVTNFHCDCNLVPGLWNDFDMGDIGALIAPRGFFIETGDKDPLNGASGLDNVASQLKISRRVFSALGAATKLKQHIFPGDHRWCGKRSIPWMQDQLV